MIIFNVCNYSRLNYFNNHFCSRIMTSTCRKSILLIWISLQENKTRRHGHGHVGDVVIEIVVTVTMCRKSNLSNSIYSILLPQIRLYSSLNASIINMAVILFQVKIMIFTVSDH